MSRNYTRITHVEYCAGHERRKPAPVTQGGR
nr:MAG TPA: hypothetical protein [Caudoviricetes sp.]